MRPHLHLICYWVCNGLHSYHTQVVFCFLPPLQVVLVQRNQMAYSSVWVGSLWLSDNQQDLALYPVEVTMLLSLSLSLSLWMESIHPALDEEALVTVCYS